MTLWKTAAAIARYQIEARRCRRAALTMAPSTAKSAMERLARRWEVIARAENAARPANDL